MIIILNYKTLNCELPLHFGDVNGYEFKDKDWVIHIRQEPGSSSYLHQWVENRRVNLNTGKSLSQGGWS